MIFYLALALFGQILASFSQILLKHSSNKEYDSVIKEYLNIFVILGYALLALSMLIAILCYNGLLYMQVVLMEPIGYVIVMFLSRIFFAEKITIRKLTGMFVIFLGIIVFYLQTLELWHLIRFENKGEDYEKTSQYFWNQADTGI